MCSGRVKFLFSWSYSSLMSFKKFKALLLSFSRAFSSSDYLTDRRADARSLLISPLSLGLPCESVLGFWAKLIFLGELSSFCESMVIDLAKVTIFVSIFLSRRPRCVSFYSSLR